MPAAEHVDVLIVGAGLSGIGAGHALQTHCKGKRYLILEARGAIGGTWDLFRYPGVRSDIDMFTLGYCFQPWREPDAIADGASILRYVRQTADEHGIAQHIRFDTRVRSASWSSQDTRWMLEVEVGAQRAPARYSCNFLYLCTGYYDYEQAFTPDFPGRDDFRGQIVHPQFWPQALDCRGQRVVVVGSGATAVTLVPALADSAAHVTMLQRSPSYVVSLPGTDGIARQLQRWLPDRLAHRLTRAKNIAFGVAFFQLCRRAPRFARRLLQAGVAKALPAGYAVDTHFRPDYAPWDQRLCVARNADLFKAIRAGRASVVTDRIERFTPDGLQLASGQALAADIVVTATGLKLKACGGLALRVDGRPVDLGERFAYLGLMLSDVPNLAFCSGYSNAAWTLRADLASRFVTRLLNHMQRSGSRMCVPVCDGAIQPMPLLDLQSGYVLRALAQLPKQGPVAPWRMAQNYYVDFVNMRLRPVARRNLVFSNGSPS